MFNKGAGELTTTGIVGVVLGAVAYCTGWVQNLWIALVLFAIIDYVTGLVGAFVQGKAKSDVGWRGVLKKVGMLLGSVVCMLADYTLSQLLAGGVSIVIPSIASLTMVYCCWNIGVELLSILENLEKWGVQWPPFMSAIFKRFKQTAEDIASADNEAKKVE